MLRKFLRTKIHRATVTQANLDYEGSCALPVELMEVADIKPFEELHIWDVSNGNRLITYAIKGDADSREISINGAAAHLIKPGDIVIIACFAEYDLLKEEAPNAKAVFVDQHNRVREVREERDNRSSML